jgi:hypothetical protein
VSPARKWDELYAELDPLGLTVIGGRVAGVGVGGLVLGCKLATLQEETNREAKADVIHSQAESHT